MTQRYELFMHWLNLQHSVSHVYSEVNPTEFSGSSPLVQNCSLKNDASFHSIMMLTRCSWAGQLILLTSLTPEACCIVKMGDKLFGEKMDYKCANKENKSTGSNADPVDKTFLMAGI